jgi:hypothetical protein
MLDRREFNKVCAALGLSLPPIGRASPFAATAGQPANAAAHTVTLPDGTTVPALGQGTWHIRCSAFGCLRGRSTVLAKPRQTMAYDAGPVDRLA